MIYQLTFFWYFVDSPQVFFSDEGSARNEIFTNSLIVIT